MPSSTLHATHISGAIHAYDQRAQRDDRDRARGYRTRVPYSYSTMIL